MAPRAAARSRSTSRGRATTRASAARGSSFESIQPSSSQHQLEPPSTPVRRPSPLIFPARNQDGMSSGEEFGPPEAASSDDEVVTAPVLAAHTFPPAHTVAMASPVKRARVEKEIGAILFKKVDLEVWNRSDDDLVDAAFLVWISEVYDHYNVGIRRNYNEDGSPLNMDYEFTCKTHPEHHTGPAHRPRMRNDLGTKNLKNHMEKCNKLEGIQRKKTPSSIPTIEYSVANHRTLIAMRCAKNARPINTILDDEYRQEVQMLRPGAPVPHPSTVAHDLVNLYIGLSSFVLAYFKSLGSKVHLALDGWTSPIIASYLGIVIIWYADGRINRAVLEFIRLSKSHTGQYLAEVTANCLKRYGLETLLLGLCMDNASNCDRLASLLPNFIPNFGGDEARLRCIAHIINLAAKIFISFFFKKPKIRKSSGQDSVLEVVAEADLAAVEEAELDAQVEQDDDGQIAHDDSTVKSLRNDAIRNMMERGVIMTAEEEETALNIFPKVAGLARRVHDQSVLNERFLELIQADQELQSSKRALDCRCPTRWNSDFDCLAAHLHFKPIIQSMTGVSNLKLKAYSLDEEQWELSEDLHEVLKLFKDITLLFSRAEVPLMVEVLPAMYQLRDSMELVVADEVPAGSDNEDEGSDSDDSFRSTPPVIRIAAKATTYLLDKYLAKFWECDIYIFAIVMCPDRKLQWFKDQKMSADTIKRIKVRVIKEWKTQYAIQEVLDVADEKEKSQKSKKSKSKWSAPQAESTTSRAKKPYDSMESYLSEPLITKEALDNAGGYLKYWDAARMGSRKTVGQMALDYISAPATSVDAECAFSAGRRQVNFMQTNMSSRVFQSRMAVGSWIKTALFPGFEKASDIILNSMSHSKSGGQSKNTEDSFEVDETGLED